MALPSESLITDSDGVCDADRTIPTPAPGITRAGHAAAAAGSDTAEIFIAALPNWPGDGLRLGPAGSQPVRGHTNWMRHRQLTRTGPAKLTVTTVVTVRPLWSQSVQDH